MSALGAHLETVFARLGIDCVVDVGAHLGAFGALLREHGYEGRIVSFEPVLAVFAALVKRRCSADPAWEAHRIALGSSDGSAELNVARSTDFSSFLEPSAFGLAEFDGASGADRRERVPVRTLDGVLAEYVPEGSAERLFLKVDTQGYDLEVLKGAAETLRRVAAMQVELSVLAIYDGMPRYHEVEAYLDRRGFVPTAYFPVTHADELRPIELDCVLVRAAEAA